MTSPITVSRSDRDAAADYIDEGEIYPIADATRKGHRDGNRLVQAFALHAQQARLAALDEAANIAGEAGDEAGDESELRMARAIQHEIIALKENPHAK